MALRRSVVATILAGSLLASRSRVQSCVTISRFLLEISVKANIVLANSGTATISWSKVRVKPIESAPIRAILRAMYSSPQRRTESQPQAHPFESSGMVDSLIGYHYAERL